MTFCKKTEKLKVLRMKLGGGIKFRLTIDWI